MYKKAKNGLWTPKLTIEHGNEMIEILKNSFPETEEYKEIREKLEKQKKEKQNKTKDESQIQKGFQEIFTSSKVKLNRIEHRHHNSCKPKQIRRAISMQMQPYHQSNGVRKQFQPLYISPRNLLDKSLRKYP